VAKKILLLASGTGSLAAAILAAHESGQVAAKFVGLISDKECPALQVAQNYGVPTFHIPMSKPPILRSHWDDQIFKTTSELNPDLVVSVGFMRILSPNYVARFQVINTHPSLLPSFPGAHAVRDALLAGAKVTGTTVHRVDAGLDTGPIISQVEVPVAPTDDESTLHERIKIAERALIVETLAKYGETGNL